MNSLSIKKKKTQFKMGWTREGSWRDGLTPILAEDLGSIPAPTQWLTVVYNCRPRGSLALCWPLREPGMDGVHIHIGKTFIHIKQ